MSKDLKVTVNKVLKVLHSERQLKVNQIIKIKKFFTYILLQMQIIIHGNIIKFFSHIHWFDFTLKELSKVNFKNWYIKLHPAGKMSSENKVNKNSQIYGNKQIIEFFLKIQCS